MICSVVTPKPHTYTDMQYSHKELILYALGYFSIFTPYYSLHSMKNKLEIKEYEEENYKYQEEYKTHSLETLNKFSNIRSPDELGLDGSCPNNIEQVVNVIGKRWGSKEYCSEIIRF